MNRKKIPINIERRLYCESMGKCMNPKCKKELFYDEGDTSEKAHIDSYSDTEDNSFENLIILCTECHTRFDKLHHFSKEEVKTWKTIRKEERDSFFQIKYTSFPELKEKVRPLILDNKNIFESYYIGDNKELWNIFENKIVLNNNIIENILNNNMHLLQYSRNEENSNQEIVRKYIQHIDEFELTRNDKSKNRSILFPTQVNSIFDIEPCLMDKSSVYVESIEKLITVLVSKKIFKEIFLGINNPYILLTNNKKIYLNDNPHINQIIFDENCFVQSEFKLEQLNFILKYLTNNRIAYTFPQKNQLSIITAKNYNIKFVFKYCLSEADIYQLAPPAGSVIVNLHRWNEPSSISQKAYQVANAMDVSLYSLQDFYGFIRK